MPETRVAIESPLFLKALDNGATFEIDVDISFSCDVMHNTSCTSWTITDFYVEGRALAKGLVGSYYAPGAEPMGIKVDKGTPLRAILEEIASRQEVADDIAEKLRDSVADNSGHEADI